AVSSDSNVATVSVSGTNVSITPVAAGTTTVTVTANDGNGGTETTTFTVTVEQKKTVFFSELIWGDDNDMFLQGIELYNPTDMDIDISNIRIERSDGGDSIALTGDIIAQGSTFTIGESFYTGGLSFDYYNYMGFFNDTSQSVTLSLYYDDVLVDIAVFTPGKSMARQSGMKRGNVQGYDSSEWIDEGTNYTDNLNTYSIQP
ncbi:hypothetical protein H8B09_21655, partial [Paenibacillus sp. PR3]|nr:hypothetical protein [Paenibacillus terricola]